MSDPTPPTDPPEVLPPTDSPEVPPPTDSEAPQAGSSSIARSGDEPEPPGYAFNDMTHTVVIDGIPRKFGIVPEILPNSNHIDMFLSIMLWEEPGRICKFIAATQAGKEVVLFLMVWEPHYFMKTQYHGEIEVGARMIGEEGRFWGLPV